MDKRLTFNEDAKNYDMFRPTYCKELFDNIINYTRLDKTKYALEVGIGTGQATKPILETGCYLTAIELGENLATYSKNKFGDYKKFTIHNISFEQYMHIPENIDLVYSGTAFHWIPEEMGYKKVYDMLRSGGTIALFWNRPSGGESEVYEEIQSVYRKYMPDVKPTKNMLNQHIYDETIETIKKYGFVDIQFKLMHQTRKFNAEDYISLLETYSDHRILSVDIKVPFYKEIMSIINNHGDDLKIYDTIDLYLAKKP
ncbi:MAG TPA: class I SAM-dependent methyltransferase [Epulopiscium sp.]|nr:class I SAM-dependent methyltransferase [Candidatus Epulonipiscium sp.]